MSKGQRKLAAIMFTDMVGFTALGQKNEALSLSLVDEQRKLVRPVLARHNGEEIKTMGDAFLVEFPSALDAVRCAYDIQRAIRELNFSAPQERQLHLRIGVHLGDVVRSEDDISGDAVNVASRIEPLAADGGVSLTRQVYDHVQNKFDVRLASMGNISLDGVSTPIEVFRMVMPWEAEASHSSKPQLDRKRVAILPFANMSPDPDDEYFADGVTEELIASLSGLGGLVVLARTSVIRYKSSQKGAHEIGKELNAGTLVEGSVRKAGNRVRITAQVIDTNTEGHVWAKNYDKQLDDIFAIQSEIAGKVTEELRVRLLESEKRKLEVKPTGDTDAYTSYLKARYHWNSRSEEGLTTAIRYFEDAVRRDPAYVPALVGLADAYSVSSIFGYVRPKTGYVRARELALKALSIDPNLAEAHASMGEILMHSSYDWAEAARELDRALLTNPNYAIAHDWRSTWYQVHGKTVEAVGEGTRALEIEPFSVFALNELAKTFYYARKFDDSIEHSVHSIELEPGSAYLHLGLAETCVQAHRSEDALREAEEALTLSRDVFILDGAASVYALANEQKKAREILSELDGLERSKFVPFYGRAAAFAALGDRQRALHLLDMAYEEQGWLIWAGVDPMFDSLREEEAFRALLRRMNLELAPVPTS